MTAADSARERMLARIRQGLRADASAERRATVARRLAEPAPPLVPERARRPAEERRQQLRAFLEGQSATFIEVAQSGEVPAAVARYLRSTNLPLRVRAGDDPYLAGLDWSSEPALERLSGAAQAGDEVGLSRAAAAVAETGTLVMASGADNPVTVNFLPETHIVVVEEAALVGGYEGAWEAIRARFGRGAMPRTVNFISGPSRTADIAGQLVMGAHGPRRLCVILVRG
jgi:L-lactate dehydrogenase complex protein LldG